MATLTGTKIKDTYDGLLKTEDSAALGVTPKKITDGLGNESGLSLSTNGNVFMENDLNVAGDLAVTGAFYDSNGGPGVSGQILSSTLTGTDWVTLSEIQGVDGTGTANKVPKWLDTETITDSSITDNGSLVSVANPVTVTGNVTATSLIKSGGTSSQFLKADGSVDSTVYATDADLTTAEGNIATNASDIAAIEAKTNFITVTQAVNLDTMESSIATNSANISTNTSNIATNTSDITNIESKTDYITVTQAVNLDTMESGIATNTSNIATNTSNIATNTSNIASNTSAIATKVSKSGDTMTGNLTAPSFIKTGGTSSQFLKADGSVDSNTYATTSDVNLSNTPSSTDVLVEISGGTDTTILAATTSLAGVMTAADKTKLDGIEAGAEVNTVDSVNSQTGAVVLDTDDISDASATNKYTTAADITKLAGIEAGAQVNTVNSVNSQTGAVVLDADDISDAATTNKFTTAADITKLAGIESGADVTDATNVAAAGAMMTGVAVLNDLFDVAAAPSDGQVLTYSTSSSSWYASTVGGGGGGSDYTVSVISGNTTAQKDYLYVATASLTLTLPATPTEGDKVAVSNMSGTTTLIIARNGSNLQGLAEDMTFNVAGYGLQFVYSGASKGWVII